jgi:hypothetical protein
MRTKFDCPAVTRQRILGAIKPSPPVNIANLEIDGGGQSKLAGTRIAEKSSGRPRQKRAIYADVNFDIGRALSQR